MDNERYDSLITRLEATARSAPQSYVRAVIAIALLGFLILGIAVGLSLLLLALLAGIVFAVVVSGGKALLVLAKLGKLLILLLLPAWTMIKSSVQLLFTRFPPPTGRELTRAEAPKLFDQLQAMEKRMSGPSVHKVLLTDDLNAAIVQHPRLGLFGWDENFLILGLPLLQTLSEDEALSVVAHEYGHLSGHHSRLGGFIYRMRISWGNLQQLSEQWQDWGSQLIARLFRWYAPYFNAYTFVFARQNEYLADRAAAELVSRETAANALMRVNIVAGFREADFWPSIYRRVADEPEPIANQSALWAQALRERLGADSRLRLLDAARLQKTDHHDTHPALTERLSAIGITIDPGMAERLEAPAVSAAQSWLGAALDPITAEFDRAWNAGVAPGWRARHTQLQQSQARLQVLDAAPSTTTDEDWERITLLTELRPETDQLPLVQALLARDAGHVPARFRRGVLLLAKGDGTGIADIEAAMVQDANAVPAGCEAAWHYYRSRDPAKAELYRNRWQNHAEHLQRVEKERGTLTADATLAPAILAEEELESIRVLVRAHGQGITRTYLLQRILSADKNLSDLVLAFETSPLPFRTKPSTVLKRLAAQEFPRPLFIVHLGTKPFKRFRGTIKQLAIQPLGI